MPIFEYQCRECGHEFEYLAIGKDTPACPSCDSKKVCKLMSTCGFVTKGAGGQTISSSRIRLLVQRLHVNQLLELRTLMKQIIRIGTRGSQLALWQAPVGSKSG